MKYIGLLLMGGIIIWAASMSPFRLMSFIDAQAIVFVLIGATGYALAGNRIRISIVAKNFGDGAVYFGWIGLLIGLSLIAHNFAAEMNSESLPNQIVATDIERLFRSLAVALLTVLYGYTFKVITFAFVEDDINANNQAP